MIRVHAPPTRRRRGCRLGRRPPARRTPVFDGLAACSSGLYLTTVDGRVLCYRAKETVERIDPRAK
jgi:hypothetical protein